MSPSPTNTTTHLINSKTSSGSLWRECRSVPPSGSYGVRNRAKLSLGCNIVGLGLAGIQTAGLIEVDEGVRPPYVDAELFPADNPFWILQKEFEDFRCYSCSSMLVPCLLQRTAFFQPLGKSPSIRTISASPSPTAANKSLSSDDQPTRRTMKVLRGLKSVTCLHDPSMVERR